MNKHFPSAPLVHLHYRTSFCAGHRLHSQNLSDEENKLLFGKCNYPHGHGHNYVLEVIIKGRVDPDSGLVMNLVALEKIVKETIIDVVDHKYFNYDIPVFTETNPTMENVIVTFWQWLQPHLPEGMLHELRLHETDSCMASYRGE